MKAAPTSTHPRYLPKLDSSDHAATSVEGSVVDGIGAGLGLGIGLVVGVLLGIRYGSPWILAGLLGGLMLGVFAEMVVARMLAQPAVPAGRPRWPIAIGEAAGAEPPHTEHVAESTAASASTSDVIRRSGDASSSD